MNIYVGSLSYDVTDAELRQAFEAFGQVATAEVMKDGVSGRSRGFGFVEMPSKEEGQAAIQGLNGNQLKGRVLSVNEARPRTQGRRDEARGGGRRRS